MSLWQARSLRSGWCRWMRSSKRKGPTTGARTATQVELVSESGSLSRASPPAAEAGSGPLPNVVVEEVVEG